MYLQEEMPDAAEYKTVVELIRTLLIQQGISKEKWVEENAADLISVQSLYNILNYTYTARYPILYEIATRLGAEISVSMPLPGSAQEKK